jgi:site-specific recombinase XerD
MLKVLGQLGRWLEDTGIDPSELDLGLVDAFCEYRRAGWRRPVERRSAELVLEYLIGRGVVPRSPCPTPSVLEGLLEVFRGWMVEERGLAEPTIVRYLRTARIFLGQRDPAAAVSDLDGVEVNRFLLAEARRCSVGAAKGRVAELRALLRFLFATGRIPVQLGAAVPPVAGWRDTGLVPRLSPEAVQGLLDSCDRATSMGVRDHAILMLLARLGLRSIEIARLTLDDVHWRQGELTVRGKGGGVNRMPLPSEVGQALAAYLAGSRPTSEFRQVFLTCRAPLRPIPAAAVGDIVRHACRVAGLPEVGPHRLRHALATAMVARGVPITAISQVLRHRDLATTALYAKVDTEALRTVARPWPGTAR